MKISILGDNTYQKRRLDEAVTQSGNQLLNLDVDHLFYYLNHDEQTVTFDRNGNVCELPDVLLVRNSSTGRKLANGILRGAGVNVIDPDDRFNMPFGKITTAIRQFQNGFVVPCYISMSKNSVINNIANIQFPLVWKDEKGSHSRGLEYLENEESLRTWLSRNNKNIYFFQRFFILDEEWRLIMLNGELVSYARKVLKADQTKFAGRRFVSDRRPNSRILEYAQRYCRSGLVGIDIATARHENRILIFEQNRAPEWEALDEKSGVNTARLIIDRLIES